MGLEMRKECERCLSSLSTDSHAYICIYECTFCEPCTKDMENRCPNCGESL